MEENTALSEQTFQLAKEDAIATHAPKGAILGSGFLAGAIVTWLPMAIYLVTFVWQALFGTVIPGTSDSKLQMALANLGSSIAAYASVAWLYSIVLGGFGVLLAYLRAMSCLINWYLRFETRNGDIRLGMHQVLGLVIIPITAGIALYYVADNPLVFTVMLIPIAMAGMLFNIVFRRLQDGFLARMYRPDHTDATVQALKVFIPRHVGANHAQVDDIHLDRDRKIAEVTGAFDSEATRKEVRQIVSHFLRGYGPVHVKDVGETKAS